MARSGALVIRKPLARKESLFTVMASNQFRAQDLNGNTVEPHTCIFPILKEVAPNQSCLIGAGFFITMLGHFVTAKHVIQDVIDANTGQQTACIHALHFVEGAKVLMRHITKVSVHNTADVAVGKMDYHVLNSTGRPLTNRVPTFTTKIPPLGSRVCTYAYPESDEVFVKDAPSKFVASYYSGEMLAHSDQPRDSCMVTWPHFTTSIDLKGGTSGGPVFDEQGHIFGINCIGGIENLSYMARATELLSLNVPEFPGECDPTVLELVQAGHILFDSIVASPGNSG